MFANLKGLGTRSSVRRTAMVAGSLALLGATLPLVGAGPLEWRGHEHGWGRERHGGEVVIRIGHPPVVLPRPVHREEVVPADLRLAAYQSCETVIVVISGTNSAPGYSTSLRAVESYGCEPGVQLCNLAPADACSYGAAPFSLSAALHVKGPTSSISIHVAGRVFQVPVCATPALN